MQLVEAAAADPRFDIDLVPVSIFWGRAPQKEVSVWRLLFTEDWVLTGRFRKLLNVVFNGRNTVVQFGEPVRLRDALDDLPPQRGVRRLMRSLRAELRAQRASTIGPDLSHRRTMVAHVLSTQAVRLAVRREMQVRAHGRGGSPPRQRAPRGPAGLAAADTRSKSPRTIRSPSSPSWRWRSAGLWNRLYDGVEFEHAGKLQEIGDGAEIIYVPCHRSHMDYLLLSYVIYRKGFAVPHIAAGMNLNLPVIGHFLRKGGAFFLRRSFKGDALYAAVFANYLGFMMARGHPAGIFHRGRPQPHRPPVVAAHRHVVDDRAQLPARPQAPGGVRAGVLRLRTHRRGQDLHRRTLGPREGKGKRARPDKVAARAAQKIRHGACQLGTSPSFSTSCCKSTIRIGAARRCRA